MEGPVHDPFAGGEIEASAPTTEPQRELLAAAAMGVDASVAFNEAVAVRFEDGPSPAILARALDVLVARHDALRLRFASDLASSCVLRHEPLVLERRDLSQVEPARREAALDALCRDLVAEPMSLTDGPLFRAVWVELDARAAELVLLAHHAVCDGWSFHVLLEELGRLLRGEDAGALPAPESFAAFARELDRRGTDPRHLSFWCERLADLSGALDLPTDRPRPPRRTFRAERLDQEFGPELLAAVQSAASRCRSTQVQVLLAGVTVLLSRLADTEDVVLATPLARQALEDRPGLVGHCVQLVPIRVAARADERFSEVVAGARAALLDAAERYDVTFGTLIRALGHSGDAARVPLAPVMVNFDQPLAPLTIGERSAQVRSVPRVADGFELFLNFVPTESGQLVIEATYNADLFGAETVAAWLDALRRLLVAAGGATDLTVGALPLVDARARVGARDERSSVSGPVEDGPDEPWPARLLEWARREPSRVAVVDAAGEVTYGELADRAGALARELARRGVTRGEVVGLATSRSRELLVALAGVHLAGAAHLPLDPEHPPARTALMLRDAGVTRIVSDGVLAVAAELEGLERIDPRAATAAGGEPPPGAALDGLAYTIYTSGSTGVPKGVRVGHAALANLLRAVAERPGFGADDVLLAVTTVSFDISLLELLLPLTCGGRVVVATRDEAEHPLRLATLVERHGVTVLQATPATWRMLIDAGWSGAPGLVACSGGERLDPQLAAPLLRRVSALWNLYGPTETTIWSTAARVTVADEAHLIGTPLANTTVHVLDARGQAVPRGMPGELCIGGAGVAFGYHNRAQLDADRFVDHVELGRVYRTGDRGRLRHDGRLECLGRLDQQVKLNGYRIELGEVEAALAALPSVSAAAAALCPDPGGGARLVAFVVGDAPRLDLRELERRVAALLPSYMVPRQWVQLDALPRLPNGKLDRRRLEAPAAQPDAADFVAPVGAAERAVCEAMASLLGRPAFGATADFFAAGGHSLLAAQLLVRLDPRAEQRLTLRDVFEAPTPRALAARLEAGRAAAAPRPEIARRQDRHVAPTTTAQERMWFLHQTAAGRLSYNLPSAHRLAGALDPARFRAALQSIVDRHAVLRTTFERREGAVVQVVHDALEVDLGPVEDLTSLPPERAREELAARLGALTVEPFDLARLPLFRAHLFRTGPDEHVFFFMPHHIVWDGWSFDLFYEEFAAAHAALARGVPPALPPLAVEYGDFAAWQRARQESAEVREQAAGWARRIEQAGPFRALAGERVHHGGMVARGATEWLEVDARRTAALTTLAREHGTTLFAATLTVYVLLLAELGDVERLLLAMPVRGRESEELERLMGCCNGLLPLLVSLEGARTLGDALASVRAAVLQSLATPEVLLESVVLDKRDAVESYQALFSFQDVRQRVLDWGGLRQEMIPLFQPAATEDLGLWFVETEGGLRGGLTYSTDVVDAATAARIKGRFLALLDHLLAGPSTRPRVEAAPGAFRLAPAASAVGSAAPGAAQGPSAPADVSVEPREGRDDLEVILCQVWRQVLAVDSVGLDDDFFALGGNSLRAIEVVRRLESVSGLTLDLGEMFRSPTIAGLASALRSGDSQPRRLLAPLLPAGEGAPLFCLLGVWLYRHLAEALGGVPPVVGVYVPEERILSSAERLEHESERTIRRLGAAYCEAVREAQPRGPYRLAGLSFGGILAMEVAARLTAAGEQVERVFLFDTLLPTGYQSSGWMGLARSAFDVIRDAFERGPGREASEPGARSARAALAESRRLGRARERAVDAWVRGFGPVSWPVSLLRVDDHSEWGRGYHFSADYGWRPVIGAGLEVVRVPGDHVGLLQRGPVEEAAAVVRRALRLADEVGPVPPGPGRGRAPHSADDGLVHPDRVR